MAEHVYEGMFIFDTNKYGRDAAGVVAAIPSTVEQLGGKMLASRLWEERRLAYPIKGQRKGTYWLSYFRLKTDQLSLLNRQLQLNDNLLRSLVLKIEPRIADAMVEHALTGGGPMAERKPKVESPVAAPVVDAVEGVEEMDELDKDAE